MSTSTVRPKVAQLKFQLLGRSVHPELFQIYKSKDIQRQEYTARIAITTDGHVISWNAAGTTLTEIASSEHQLVPQGRQIVSTPLRATGGNRIPVREGLEYEYRYELERVPAEMFWMIQQQLEQSTNHELIHVFDASGRIAIGGMSFIHVDRRAMSLHVQAIHTFPDDLALVKTESNFRLTSDSTEPKQA